MSTVYYYDYGYSSYSSSNDDWIIYVIVGGLIWCLIWGFVTKAIMKGKGYENTGSWFICGFLLGIIGVIIAACQTNLNYVNYQNHSGNSGNTTQPPINAGSKSTTVCKSCGATNSSSSYHCQSCGAKLSKAVIAQTTGKEGQWRCKCGAMNYPYETSCHRCGEKKPFSSKSESKTASSTSSPVTSQVPAQKSITEQLEELKKLQEQGLITEADFEAKKKQILNI